MTAQAPAAEHEQGPDADPLSTTDAPGEPPLPVNTPPREIGGRQGPEPTRFGDWEMRGRCIDF